MFTTDAMPTLNAYGAVFTLHETADGSRCLYMAAQPQVRRAGTDLWVDIPAEEIPRGALPLGEVPIRDKDMEEVTLLSSLEDLLTEKEMHDQVQRIVAAWKEGCETLQDATDVHSWDVLRYGEVSTLCRERTQGQGLADQGSGCSLGESEDSSPKDDCCHDPMAATSGFSVQQERYQSPRAFEEEQTTPHAEGRRYRSARGKAESCQLGSGIRPGQLPAGPWLV